jgi:hypothetical protein
MLLENEKTGEVNYSSFFCGNEKYFYKVRNNGFSRENKKLLIKLSNENSLKKRDSIKNDLLLLNRSLVYTYVSIFIKRDIFLPLSLDLDKVYDFVMLDYCVFMKTGKFLDSGDTNTRHLATSIKWIIYNSIMRYSNSILLNSGEVIY